MDVRQLRSLAVLGLLAAGVGSAGCERGDALSSPAAQAGENRIQTDGLLRGMAIQIDAGYDAFEKYAPLLREVADLGANSVLLSSAAYMEHARSQAIFLDVRKVPPPAVFVRLVDEAHKLGLKVILMPIVLLSHPRGSEWRGVIDPPDWADWWRQYRDVLKYFAAVARDGKAEAMIVGSELISTERQLDQWETSIWTVRAIYSGPLGYSANWDHYKPVRFWDKLDFVAMTSYYTLADHANPTVDELIERWKPIREEILRWRAKVNKPILFTEVGWCSQEGAATAPWNYYQNMKATPAGLEEQRRLYEAFMRVWTPDTPGLMGVMWWEWDRSAGGPGDYGYTPRGKPAERLLRQWFAEGRTKPRHD